MKTRKTRRKEQRDNHGGSSAKGGKGQIRPRSNQLQKLAARVAYLAEMLDYSSRPGALLPGFHTTRYLIISRYGQGSPMAYPRHLHGLSWRGIGFHGTLCGFRISETLRCSSVRFSGIVNATVRFGFVMYHTVRFGAVRCGFEKAGTLRCSSVVFPMLRCGSARFSDSVNPTARFGAVILPKYILRCGSVRFSNIANATVRFGTVFICRSTMSICRHGYGATSNCCRGNGMLSVYYVRGAIFCLSIPPENSDIDQQKTKHPRPESRCLHTP